MPRGSEVSLDGRKLPWANQSAPRSERPPGSNSKDCAELIQLFLMVHGDEVRPRLCWNGMSKTGMVVDTFEAFQRELESIATAM